MHRRLNGFRRRFIHKTVVFIELPRHFFYFFKQVIEVGAYSKMEAPSSLKTLCRFVETTLLPEDKTVQFTIDKEVFGGERDTFLLPEDITQFAGMEEIGATVLAVYMRFVLLK